jgi:hypothetical protein
LGADHSYIGHGSGDGSIDGEGIGMIKPIVPGCLAWARPHPSRNEPDHVVDVLHKWKHFNRACRLCGASESVWLVHHPVYESHNNEFYCACSLIRIDGHDPDAEITETDKDKEKCLSI